MIGNKLSEGKVSPVTETTIKAPAKQKPRRKKRHILRSILISLLVLAVLAAGALYAYEALRQKYTVTYTGYTAATGSISNALSFSGSLQLIDNKTYTAGRDTTVRAVYVSVGDDVKEGDRLMRLANGETIKADFDGRVNTLNVEAGDSVTGAVNADGVANASATSLMQVADFAHLKVSIRVDEYDIASVSVGQACRVTATATEKQFDSKIASIDYISASSGNVAYYTATAYVDVDPNEGVYPGMQVTVTVPQEEAENVVVLNMNALSFDETNSAFVFMMGEDGAMTAVPVEVGVSNGSYVEIRSGLNGGDTVYAETQVETSASGLAGLMQNMFGGQQIMPGEGGFNRQNRTNTNTDRDFSNFPGGGNMPSGGFGGGGR